MYAVGETAARAVSPKAPRSIRPPLGAGSWSKAAGRVAGVDARGNRAAGSARVPEPVVLLRRVGIGVVDEQRVVEGGRQRRVADRMVVEVRLDLPVEQVAEVFLPVDDPAGPRGEQVVVVAGEADLAVAGDVQVVPGARPEDVVVDRGIGRARIDRDGVAEGRVDRVALDVQVARAIVVDAVRGVEVDDVVIDVDRIRAGRPDARRVPIDEVEVDEVVALGIDPDYVVMDQVRIRPVRPAEHAEPGQADLVVVDRVPCDRGRARPADVV